MKCLWTALFLGLILFQIPADVHSQEDTAPSGQAWYYLHNSVFINNRLSYLHDIGFRQEFPAELMWRIYYRPSMRYAAGDIVDVFGGLAFSSTHEKDAPGIFEFRPWQAVRFDWPSYGRFRFDHFIRVEERFLQNTREKIWTPALRGRYRLNLSVPLNRPKLMDKTLFFKTNAEFFLNSTVNEDTERCYHRRFDSGFGYRVDPRWTMELLYAFTNTSPLPYVGMETPVHVLKVRLRRAIFPN